MKSFTAGANENDVRLSRFVEGVTKDMPRSMMYKAFRNKRIKVNGKTAIIEGGRPLSAAALKACDLRAGAAMIIAGLAAPGTTSIDDVYYIERGYDNIVGKLRAVGADITLQHIPDEGAFNKAN